MSGCEIIALRELRDLVTRTVVRQGYPSPRG